MYLTDLLDKPEVKKGLKRALKAVYRQLEDRPDQWRDFGKVKEGRLHPCESRDVQDQSWFIKVALGDLIISQLPHPITISDNELMRAFQAHLLVPLEDFDRCYPLFAARLRESTRQRYSERFPLAIGTLPDLTTEDYDLPGGRAVSREELDGRVLEYEGSYPILDFGITAVKRAGALVEEYADDRQDGKVRLLFFARVEGEGSQDALDAFAREHAPLFRSILNTYFIITQSGRGEVRRTPDGAYLPLFVGPTFPFDHGLVEAPAGTLSGSYNPYNFFDVITHFPFPQNPAKLDTEGYEVDRRVTLAIQLLAQADQQSHDAIALTLCSAAMEALAVLDKENVTQQLAENAAALLDDDEDGRKKATKLIKRLYNLRCDAVHGRALEALERDRIQTRQVAACLLMEVLEWKAYRRRLGIGCESCERLLCHLKSLRENEGQYSHVSECKWQWVRSLWRDTK